MYFLVDLYSARVGGRVEEGVEEEEEEEDDWVELPPPAHSSRGLLN
jgi:hypothetical protein